LLIGYSSCPKLDPLTLVNVEEPRKPNFIDEWLVEYFIDYAIPSKRLGFGKTPAILIIDFQKNIRETGLIGRAIQNTAILLEKAREKHIPLFYSVIGFRADMKDFVPNKMTTLTGHIVGTDSVEVIDKLEPKDDDVIITKKTNSMFIGTDLALYLNRMRVDTLIITGCHTGGCVRASATDSYSLGYRTILPEECVGDGKGLIPHKSNLCDLHIRGADVITIRETMEYLDQF